MANTELNPECPICHEMDGELFHTPEGKWCVFCFECGTVTDDHDTAEDAIAQWNEGRLIDARI